MLSKKDFIKELKNLNRLVDIDRYRIIKQFDKNNNMCLFFAKGINCKYYFKIHRYRGNPKDRIEIDKYRVERWLKEFKKKY